MSTHLSPEMLLLLDKMKEQLNLQTNIITENITTAVLKQVDEKIKPIIEENAKLKTEIDNLTRKIENLETNGKRNNILIHGLLESQDESQDDLQALVTSKLKDIDVILKEEEINRIQRLGKVKEEGKIRPILLATTTLQKKIQILKNKKKMSPNTYITQDLSKEALLKKKEKYTKNKKPYEKRKRPETPSPKNSDIGNRNDPKIKKRDAFQYMRERAQSLSDKHSQQNEKTDTTNRTTTTN